MRFRGGLRTLLCILLTSISLQTLAGAAIAIIIDDLGDSRHRGERAIALPGSVTLAVLPHTPWATELAELAGLHRREVMLHLPMATIADAPLGPNPLMPQLSKTEFLTRIGQALDRVPGARGINNHMGSALTQQPREMAWLMEEIKRRRLYFIDSRTTHKTVASSVARGQNVLTASRDVFLDNQRNPAAIEQQFRTLLRIARKRGTAVGIGHPYPETMTYLERVLPRLQKEDITLVPASSVVALQKIKAMRGVPLTPAVTAGTIGNY